MGNRPMLARQNTPAKENKNVLKSVKPRSVINERLAKIADIRKAWGNEEKKPVTMTIDPSKVLTPKRTEIKTDSPVVKPVQLKQKSKFNDIANRYKNNNSGIDDLFDIPQEKAEKMDVDNKDKEVEPPKKPEPAKRKSLHNSQVVPNKRQSLDTKQQKLVETSAPNSTSTP